MEKNSSIILTTFRTQTFEQSCQSLYTAVRRRKGFWSELRLDKPSQSHTMQQLTLPCSGYKLCWPPMVAAAVSLLQQPPLALHSCISSRTLQLHSTAHNTTEHSFKAKRLQSPCSDTTHMGPNSPTQG